MDDEINLILNRYSVNPQNTNYYSTAFTHRSYLNEVRGRMESNERMEFLGDSVLSLVISTYLYKHQPHSPEGELTHTRAYIVKTESLAKVAQSLNLGNFLRLSRGEEISGGRNNPQLLANTYEALVGAIYLDLGLEQTRSFILQTLLPTFEEDIKKGAPKDNKSQLQEVTQSKFQISPRYKVLETFGPDHAKHFKIGVFVDDKLLGIGEGSSKQQAEEEAAKKALTALTE